MNRKLKCVMVDDSPYIIQGMKELCGHSLISEITHTFTNPQKFLEVEDTLHYDLCILDILMPGMDGLTVAKKITKPIIFITMAEEKLKAALAFSPIDVVTKPFSFERLTSAFEKAQKIIMAKEDDRNYVLFNILEEHAKMRRRLSDILYVKTCENNPRNKYVLLKENKKYTISDCTFERLLQVAPNLIRINKTELISIEAVKSFKYDLINLNDVFEHENPKQVTLSNIYKENFMERMPKQP